MIIRNDETKRKRRKEWNPHYSFLLDFDSLKRVNGLIVIARALNPTTSRASGFTTVTII